MKRINYYKNHARDANPEKRIRNMVHIERQPKTALRHMAMAQNMAAIPSS